MLKLKHYVCQLTQVAVSLLVSTLNILTKQLCLWVLCYFLKDKNIANSTWHKIGACYFACYRLLILLLLLVNFFCLCKVLSGFEGSYAKWHF